MTRTIRNTMLLTMIALMGGIAVEQEARAFQGYRQYYGGWSYKPQQRYHVRSYYYKPTPSYVGYRYHYCVHYPKRPRYVYYYNPYSRTYWGRFDLEGKDGAHYSLLKNEDRKENLEEIPESAFPAASKMPQIPEAEDDIQIDVMPKDLPTAEDTPQ
ncbi:hypothetical protein [Rubinisphaera italica]|uniref:Uncharacterized protein n=1 Tax=Rubinisphaera italica TaxID=2527969 RepID=A0A5C5XF04_9PLAN|nr:hypothetical protein [Rubinisphaera italica]TWT61239.1 hypothetical protein Pan54_19740 [Rubinisphaera italica]